VKIIDIKTYLMHCAPPEEGGWSARNWLFVKVETDAGIYGIGEASGWPRVVETAIRDLTPLMLGEDPCHIEKLWSKMLAAMMGHGMTGVVGAGAMTGIEIALWDLKGKALKVPIYELLGGKFRDRIRVYADCEVNPGMDFGQITQVVDGVLERGFTAFKIDVDGGSAKDKDAFNKTASEWEHDRMVRLVEMAHRAAGEEIAVGVDVHTNLDVPSAVRLARDLEQFHVMWLEEPVPPENYDAMREVKRSSSTPICSGENLYLRHGFRDLIEKQAVDIIMPDIPKCGGLSECRKIANLAELYYIPFAPHNVASPIGTLASAHTCATIPNFLIIEFHWLQRDYWTTIIQEKEDIIKDGYIHLSDRPGIGVELDEEVGRQYQYPGTSWFA